MLLYLYWPESSHLEFQSWDIDVQPESEGNVQFTAWQVPENLIKVSLWKDGENFAENSQNQGEQDTKVGQNESGTISPPKTQGKKKRQRGKGKLPKVAPS